MTRKKILFVIPTLGGGGAERVVCNIANHLSEEKYQVCIFVVKEGNHVHAKGLKSHVQVVYGNYTKRTGRSVLFVLKNIRKLKPHTVFMCMGELSVLLAPFIPFLRQYQWISRETNVVSVRLKSKLWVFKVLYIFYKLFYNNYDKIIAQCEDMKQDLVAHCRVKESKIRVINNPVDTHKIDQALSAEKEQALYSANKINLVACGRLSYQKGFDLLLKEFASMKHIEQYHLTIIGSSTKGDWEDRSDEINQLIKELSLEKHVSLVPFQSNIYSWLQAADVFVLSSRYEGFPNVLLEAIYCGTPAVAHLCPGGISEIITPDNGRTFHFYKEWKIDSFEQAVTKVLCTNYGERHLKYSISHRYGTEVILPKYVGEL